MYCVNCGKELADGTKFCPNCGTKNQGEMTQGQTYSPKETQIHNISSTVPKSYVTVHGYDERFAVNPSVSVYKDGVHSGEVARHGQIKVEIESNCTLKFTCGPRSTSLFINKGTDTHVLLSFDRLTGSLKAKKSGDSNLGTVAQEKEEESSNATMWSILLIAFFFILWLIL